MKKNFVLRTILLLTLVTFLMCGCSKATVETMPVEETTAVTLEESTEEIVEETETQEEVSQPAEETPAEENAEDEEISEDPTGETYNGMPVAKVVTTVSNIDELMDYIATYKDPGLFIYNENEGYVIKMEEEEYYQLKKNDRIFEHVGERGIGRSDTLEAGIGTRIYNRDYSIDEMTPDYSKYDSPHKVIFVVYYTEKLYEGEKWKLTCYLDAPVE